MGLVHLHRETAERTGSRARPWSNNFARSAVEVMRDDDDLADDRADDRMAGIDHDEDRATAPVDVASDADGTIDDEIEARAPINPREPAPSDIARAPGGSRQRGGTLFGESDRTTDRSSTPLQSALSIRNILVVDDDEHILRAWKRAARERHIVTASDAATARKLASTEPLDLAIVDLKLGTGSGIELIRQLKQDHPDLRVVLCSGYLSVPSTLSAMRAGADTVVFKPITLREILQRLEAGTGDPELPDLEDLEDTPTLARAEREHIERVLADCGGNVSRAARRLGIYRSSLQRRLRKLGLRRT
jgi:two-component system, response regulator RegA